MCKHTTIFERLEAVVRLKGLRTVSELAGKLGYKSPEKLLRLKRGDGRKPSLDIVEDMANLYLDLDMRWLVTGRGEPFGLVAEENSPEREDALERLKERLREKDELMESLRGEMAAKDKLIAVMDEYLASLKKG